MRQLLTTNPALAAEELKDARRELLRTERSALMGLRRDGVISEEVFEKLVAEVDAALIGPPDLELPEAPQSPQNGAPVSS